MIEFIIRRFIKNYEDTDDKHVREQYSILGGILGILCNLFLFVSKFLVGMMSNSIGILSDAFNNLTDMGSSFISIISAKLSNRPPDKEHPFGHGRFEYLASLTIPSSSSSSATSSVKRRLKNSLNRKIWNFPIGASVSSSSLSPSKSGCAFITAISARKSIPASMTQQLLTALPMPSPRRASWSLPLPNNSRPCPSMPLPARLSA